MSGLKIAHVLGTGSMRKQLRSAHSYKDYRSPKHAGLFKLYSSESLFLVSSKVLFKQLNLR